MNLAGAKMLGADRSDVIGFSLLEYIVEPDRAAFQAHIRECVGDGRETTAEVRIQTKDGRQMAVQLHSIPVEESDQAAIFCKTAFTDITARRQAEEQLKTANETLEQRVAERTAEAEHRAEQLQALASQLSQTEQRERHRLAQVVEDHLQHLLIAAKLKLATLTEHLRDQALRCTAAQAEALLEQSIAEARALSAELSPPVLYDAGLAAGLEWLLGRLRQKYGLEVESDVDVLADPADEGLRVFLFQAVHQLLLNVVEHAQTKCARVRVARLNGERMQIEVADDGVGFDPTRLKAREATAGGAFGLFGIRERLDVLGGFLETTAAPGEGTRMVMVAPLRLAARSRSARGSLRDPCRGGRTAAAQTARRRHARAAGRRSSGRPPGPGGTPATAAGHRGRGRGGRRRGGLHPDAAVPSRRGADGRQHAERRRHGGHTPHQGPDARGPRHRPVDVRGRRNPLGHALRGRRGLHRQERPAEVLLAAVLAPRPAPCE